jgi:hypothetical protein
LFRGDFFDFADIKGARRIIWTLGMNILEDDVAIPFNANESTALAFETIDQAAEAVSKLVAEPA